MVNGAFATKVPFSTTVTVTEAWGAIESLKLALFVPDKTQLSVVPVAVLLQSNLRYP